MTNLARRVTTVLLGSAVAFSPALAAGPAFAATGHPTAAHHVTAAKHQKHQKHAVKHVKHAVKKKAKHPVAPAHAVSTVKAPASTSPATPSAGSPVALSAYEARLVVDVNNARTAVGLPTLTVAAGPTDVARRWSLKLASDGTLSHNPNLVKDLSAAGASNWRALAENVGMASGQEADDVFAAYMASPGHKANILSATARYVGIGDVVVTDASGTTTFNTMDFTDAYSASYGAARTSTVAPLDASGLATLAGTWGVKL